MVIPPTLTYAVDADLDLNGSYETSLLPYLPPDASIRIERGLGKDGIYKVSQMNLQLINRDGSFTPFKTGSLVNGRRRLHAPVRFQITHNGIVYPMWTGYARRWHWNWSALNGPTSLRNRAAVTCEDLFSYLNDGSVDVLYSSSRTVDAAISAVASAMGLTAGDLSLDTSGLVLPAHFVRGNTPSAAIMDAVRSEMGGFVWVTADGKIRFERRQRRLGISYYRQVVLDDRPRALWPMIENSGTTAYDHARNGQNGTYQGGPALGVASPIVGDEGLAAEYSTSTYVTVPDSAYVDLGDTFTLEAWVRPRISQTTTIMDKGTGGYQLGLVANALVLVKTGTATIVTGTDTLASAAWSHVVATKSGATVKLYHNGVDVTGVVTNQTCVDTASALNIARTVAGTGYLDGRLCNVAVYNTALSAAQVLKHYNSGITGRVWGDGGVISPYAYEYDEDPSELIATARVRATTFQTGQAGNELFRFDRGMSTRPTADSIAIAAGGQYGPVVINSPVPFVSLTAPVANTDYAGNTAANGSGTDRTSSLTVSVTSAGDAAFTIQINNTHATDTVYVTFFRIRGQQTSFIASSSNYEVSKSVPGAKANTSVDIDLPWVPDTNGLPQDYAYQLCRTYRRAYVSPLLSFKVDSDAMAVQMLGSDIGDLITYKDTAVADAAGYLNDKFYLIGMTDEFVPGRLVHSQRQLIPSWLFRDLDHVEYDNFNRANTASTLGKSLSGATWTGDGSVKIASNAAQPTVTTAIAPTINIGGPNFDQVVECSLSNLSAGASAEAGVVYRYIDANNYWRAYVSKVSSKVILEFVEAGFATVVAQPAWVPTDTAEIMVRVQGGRHRVEVDFAEVVDFSTAVYANIHNVGSSCGIYAKGATTTNFDDWYASAL